MGNELPLLLDEISKKDLKTYSPEKPNLFYMLGIEHNEVLICRLIAALIQPNGLHGMGVIPLKLFLNELGKYNFSNENISKAEIRLEEQIVNNRRVDIAIYIGQYVIPIEVKIWAKDQESQLFDYYYYYKNRYKEFKNYKIDKIYYLSPNRHAPSEDSLKRSKAFDKCEPYLHKDKYECISFEKEIKDFLVALKKETSDKHESEILNIINNFIEVIDKMNIDEKNIEQINEYMDDISDNNKQAALSALLMILNYKDEIWDRILFNYFVKSLKDYNPDLVLEKAEEGSCKVDKYSKYIIKNSNKEIAAWLCIETNLYIVRKFNLPDEIDGWKSYNDSHYKWKHIKYDGLTKAWNLKNINLEFSLDKKIKWKKYLD